MLVGTLCAVPGVRADGMLDPSFGNGGLVVTNFPGSFSQDRALSLLVLPDGRALAGGYTNINLANTDMAIARYLVSGSLDPTFDGDGKATVHFPGAPPFFGSGASAESILLQPDGKLVLVGHGGNDYGPYLTLARLNPDGSLDPSFGSEGMVTTSTSSSGDVSGLLQPDGRILAATHDGTTIVVVRFDPDGSLDPTFDGDGQVIVPGSFVDIQAAVLQPDGKVVVAGTSQIGGFLTRNFALVRLMPNGALDPSFDGDGIVISDFGGIESGYSVILLGNGRLVLAGSRGTELPNFLRDVAVARYLPDGSLDTTFGNGGLALVDAAPSETAHQIIELPNGNLLLAGATYGQFTPLDFLLVRLLPNGWLDTTFGTGGFLVTDFNRGSDECIAVALAGPDLLLTAGGTGPAPDPPVDFALARYIASTPVELLAFSVE